MIYDYYYDFNLLFDFFIVLFVYFIYLFVIYLLLICYCLKNNILCNIKFHGR